MPFITRRRNESLWKRLFAALKATSEKERVCPQEAFQFELVKEISRSNRRQYGREFALIHFSVPSRNGQALLTEAMLDAFEQRIRISDTIGWHSSNLAVLLPETDRKGAQLVADDLARLAARHGWNAEPVIYVYPWDDNLISVSNEIAGSVEAPKAPNKPESDNDAMNDVESDDFADGFERTDSFDSDRLEDKHHARSSFRDRGNGNGFVDLMETGSVQLTDRAVLPARNEKKRYVTSQTSLVSTPSRNLESGVSGGVMSPQEEARLNAMATSISASMVETIPTPWWKRTIDIVGAGTGLIVLFPVLIAAAIAIKATSPGPILFRQKREGKGGKQFDILKFRTMVVDAESKQASLKDASEQDGPAFKLKDDPRITAVGRKLRTSCIDELPQLVNVLVGQMSLVGPRPLPVAESSECSPWQRMRLTVLPGLTCTWQVRGGRQVSFDQWMRMDLDYIRNQGFVSDVRLIVETVFIALLHRGSV